MPTESLAKSNVTSGTREFKVGSDGLVEVVIPVAEAKHSEALPLLDDIYRIALTHYYKTEKLNPRDVARTLRSVADTIERYQIKFTEDKYNGRARKPRK